MDSSLTPTDAVAIVPSDVNPLNLVGLYVGGTGNVTVVTDRNRDSGITTLFNAVPVGTVLNLRIFKVMATGTSATLMTGLRS